MATLMYSFWRSLEGTWRAVCADIARGEVRAVPGLDAALAAELNALLTPDPLRAQQLVTCFEAGFRGVARRIWPNCR